MNQMTYDIQREPWQQVSKLVNAKFGDGNLLDLDTQTIIETSAHAWQIAEAAKIANECWMDPYFGDPGRRNKDAVNMSIALHVLGCCHVIDWFKAAQKYHANLGFENFDALMEHVQKVEPYLCSWGPDSDRGRALDKLI